MKRGTKKLTKKEDIAVIKNLKRYFRQGEIVVKALDNVSLTLSEGEFAALVGPSGSGKTTLLNCIGALDIPSSGKLVLDGQELSTLKEKELSEVRLHKIGFVFQAYNLIPVMTALENIEYVLILQGMPKEERREKTLSLLKEMDMKELENRFPHELSGGQQQRVAVARALVSEPKIILADEPTANLDSKNAEKLLDIMQKMSRSRKATFLFSTHDDKVIKRVKRIIKMKDGRLCGN